MSDLEKILAIKSELEATRTKLPKSEKEVVTTIELQNKFIKDAIHEIHTPLSIIITNKDLIRMKYGDIKFLDSIEAACKVIQNSYEDLSYHVQLDKVDMKTSQMDLVDFVRWRCEYFDSIAVANELKLHFSSSVDSFMYDIAEIKLQRLVDNNISNAIKYANVGTIIDVNIELSDDTLELRFSNLGRVIKDKKAIFNRFHREDNVKGGYGIGLNLVYDICKSQNIGINLISSAKTGTIFCYSFKNQKLQHKGDKK